MQSLANDILLKTKKIGILERGEIGFRFQLGWVQHYFQRRVFIRFDDIPFWSILYSVRAWSKILSRDWEGEFQFCAIFCQRWKPEPNSGTLEPCHLLLGCKAGLIILTSVQWGYPNMWKMSNMSSISNIWHNLHNPLIALNIYNYIYICIIMIWYPPEDNMI